jgi:maltooligosyltrehalose synthase
VVAFLRRHEGRCVLVVVVRLFAALASAAAGDAQARHPAWRGESWGDTRLLLPQELAGRGLEDCLTGKAHRAAPELGMSALLTHFPGAVLVLDAARGPA